MIGKPRSKSSLSLSLSLSDPKLSSPPTTKRATPPALSKRLLAMLLALALVCSGFVAMPAAFAVEPTGPTSDETIAPLATLQITNVIVTRISENQITIEFTANESSGVIYFDFRKNGSTMMGVFARPITQAGANSHTFSAPRDWSTEADSIIITVTEGVEVVLVSTYAISSLGVAPLIPPVVVGVAPTIAGDATITLTEGYAKLTKNYTIAGTPAPTVSLVGAPAGLSITAAGALTIPAGLKAGNYSFTIKAQNASGTVNKAVAVKVNQKLVKPTITGGKSKVTLKKNYKKTTIAFKVKGFPAPTFSITKAPKSIAKKITISKTGKLTIKKGIKPGTYKVTITAKNSQGKATKTVTIKVKK